METKDKFYCIEKALCFSDQGTLSSGWKRKGKEVEDCTELFTDALKSYRGLDSEYAHQVVDHAEQYVDGKIHTNGLENFWSLLKRTIIGTYVAVEPFHLERYLDEQAFRFNERKEDDRGRFVKGVRRVEGRRLTSR